MIETEDLLPTTSGRPVRPQEIPAVDNVTISAPAKIDILRWEHFFNPFHLPRSADQNTARLLGVALHGLPVDTLKQMTGDMKHSQKFTRQNSS